MVERSVTTGKPDPSKANLPLTASSTSRDYSLASRIQRALIDTLAGLASHQASEPKAQYVLQPVAAPRYWQPAEPVILLTGGMAQTDDRRNRGVASSDGGLLPCRLLDIERDVIGKDRDGITLEQLRNGVDSGPHPGARVWTEQPWHPFMLEWEVELTPFKHLSNLATKATDYDSQFVTRNFTLKRSDVDLSPKANEPALAQGAHVYRGSSLLTPHGIDLYVARLKEYLEQAHAEEAAGKSDRSPLNADTRQRLEKALTKLKAVRQSAAASSRTSTWSTIWAEEIFPSTGADYSFSGQMIDGTKLNIKEILSHFLRHSRYQDLPEMEVRDFSFSAQPKSKIYEGEILLHGDWSIPGLSSLSLQGVFFRLRHEGEGDTVFQAFGSFELGGARLFVSADYVSDGHGWTFAGGSYKQEKFPVGDWLDDITKMFGLGTNIQLPAPVRGLEVSGLGARFNTATKDFSFHGTAEFPVDGKKDGASNAKLTVQVDLEHKPDQTSHALTFGGSLQLFEREFAVNYGSQGNTSLLVAAYDGAKVDQIEFKDFVSQISQDVAAVIPRGVKIDLKRAQLAFGKIGKTSKFLFGVELGAGIQLSNLPLVGQVFDRSQTLSVVLQILAANADFETDEVKQINQLTASGVTKLPENRISVSERKVHLKASVQFSGISQQLDLPLETNVESSTAAASPGIVSTAPKDEKSVKWFTIQKAIGPLHFDRFGICLRAGNIEFLLDASLMMAGLTIALQGLAAECALTELSKGNFQPTFHLDGLGIVHTHHRLESLGRPERGEGRRSD